MPSAEIAIARAESTRGTRRAAAMTRASVFSAATPLTFPVRTATIVTVLLSLRDPRIGAASDAACELGVLDGRNWLLSLLISLERLGNAAEVITTTAIHSGDDEPAKAHDDTRERREEAVAHAVCSSCGRVASWLGVVRRGWGLSAIREKRTCATGR